MVLKVCGARKEGALDEELLLFNNSASHPVSQPVTQPASLLCLIGWLAGVRAGVGTPTPIHMLIPTPSLLLLLQPASQPTSQTLPRPSYWLAGWLEYQ